MVYYACSNEDTMRKQVILGLAIATILVLPTLLTVSANSPDFLYIPQHVGIQVSSNTVDPNGIPLCRLVKPPSNITCYTPNFIRKAYNFPSGMNGSGQTILIVDAFGSPTIRNDLNHFDSVYHIKGTGTLTILCPNGCPPFNPRNKLHDEFGWALETSLDVEYAHAMAPDANIVLVVASTSSGNDINQAETKAIAQFPGSVISQSFGIPEGFIRNLGSNAAQIMQAHDNYVTATSLGDTILASSGDTGADFGLGFPNANYPASDPLVTGVGGTQGLPYNATGNIQPCPASTTCTSGLATYTGPCVLGRTIAPNCTPQGYGGEQVWNEPSFGVATGGAQSLIFGVPSFQSTIAGLRMRGTPDVSYNAAIDGGVLVYTTFLGLPANFIVGGTSAGSPMWAGIIAIINQARAAKGHGLLGYFNPKLYSLTTKGSDFHDITVGNNKLLGTHPGFSATSGWDLATGWGTPNVANLVTDLA